MIENKNHRRPIIDPLKGLLKSRRVLVALTSLIVSLLVMTVPQIAPLHDELLLLVGSLALTLIGGFSLEDAMLASKTASIDEDLRATLSAINDAILDELLLLAEQRQQLSGDVENARPDHTSN